MIRYTTWRYVTNSLCVGTTENSVFSRWLCVVRRVNIGRSEEEVHHNISDITRSWRRAACTDLHVYACTSERVLKWHDVRAERTNTFSANQKPVRPKVTWAFTSSSIQKKKHDVFATFERNRTDRAVKRGLESWQRQSRRRRSRYCSNGGYHNVQNIIRAFEGSIFLIINIPCWRIWYVSSYRSILIIS